MQTVVAGLIFRDSKLLICQRRTIDAHPLKWEFPGGKVEVGETLPMALARELLEELDVTASIGNQLHSSRHRYRGTEDGLLLVFLRATINEHDVPRNVVFEKIEWVEIAALRQYDFLQADYEVLGLLASKSIQLD